MRADIKEILTDINAAMRIQHTDSILLALDKILALPEVSGNQVLENRSIKSIVLPIGTRLFEKNISIEIYDLLSHSDYAVFRSIAAVITAGRFADDANLDLNIIKEFGQEHRRDVSLALTFALTDGISRSPEKILATAKVLISDPLDRLQIIALNLLPDLFRLDPEDITSLLTKFESDDDPDLKRAFADALISIANHGYTDNSINIIESLNPESSDHNWITLRALSASWAVKHEDQAISLIEGILTTNEESKQIINTLIALKRNGAKNIETHIEQWNKSTSTILNKTAESYFTHENRG